MNAAVNPCQSSMWDVLSLLFNKKLHSEADILELVERGISTASYRRLVTRLGVPHGVIGAETTIRNRLKNANARLNAEESERLVRIARVYASAQSLFGSEEKTLAWMHKPARYLPNKQPLTPMALATRDAGVRLLEDKLIRTAQGMY